MKQSASTGSRTIFIGDVHGCIGELKEMIHAVRPVKEDRIIMLGDLINRGPDPAGVVRFVEKAGYECLMGNHEQEYLNEYKENPVYKNLRTQLGDRLHKWISQRPLFIESENFLAVHAGVVPGEHPSRSKKEIIQNIRTWDGKGKDLRNQDNPPWYELYTGKKPVFYGHWARRGLNLRENTMGIDTGCVYGRALSAFILETKELIQIKAKEVYYIPPSLRKNDTHAGVLIETP